MDSRERVLRAIRFENPDINIKKDIIYFKELLEG